MAHYVALVDGRSGSYGLTVPDLPGCTSAAATIDTVLRKATEAVRLPATARRPDLKSINGWRELHKLLCSVG
jgi:predicted RNase H-like HicB family nuclease